MMNLKTRLADPAQRLVMEMCIVPSATMAQAIATSGVDILVVDMEHAATTPETLQAMIAATQGPTARRWSG
jgi:4-hydroxy-2-oxoheptanedioate aldolase